MTNKRDTAILGIAITLVICYIGTRIWKQKSVPEDSEIKIHENPIYYKGLVAFREKDWASALSLFQEIQNPGFEVLFLIAQCCVSLGNSVGALSYLEKSISLSTSYDNKGKNSSNSSLVEEISKISLVDAVKLRFQIHSTLGMLREAFKDLFLINLIDNTNESKEKANEFLKKLCFNLSKSHKIKGVASPINFTDFFDTLFFLNEKQDPAIVFINSREFKKCYEYVLESSDPLHKFILGCLYLCNGHQDEAINILSSINCVYANILTKFLKSKKLNEEEICSLRNQIKTETDPTILFYISKIFENIGDSKSQFEALQTCVSICPNSPAYCSLAVLYIKQKNHQKATSFLRLALKEFPDSVNLVCIALEYFLLIKEIEEATKIMEMSEKLFGDDPRLYLFKYMISEVLGKPDISFLQKGISIDPKYYKLHVYYGNVCNTGEESLEAYQSALSCARTFDEIFASYQLIVVIEAQNELYKEFPNFFDH